MRRAAVQTIPVATAQDWAFASLSDREVNGSCRARNQWDQGGLVPLAHNPQDAMAPLHPQVLDVGAARLTDPQTIETKENGEPSMRPVEALGGEEEGPEFATVHAPDLISKDSWAADELGWVRPDSTIEVGEAIKAAHSREPPVDGRRCKSPLFESGAVQLNVTSGCGEDVKTGISGPSEVGPKIVPIGLEGAVAITSQECSHSQVSWTGDFRGLASVQGLSENFNYGHLDPPHG
jgi:hypothetical protein